LARRVISVVPFDVVETYDIEVEDKKHANYVLASGAISHNSYGFNKSHAVEYGMISYWTMYLKVYYPLEFYWALLKNEPTAALAREIEALSTDRDVARVRGRAVHMVITDPYHHAQLTNATIEKQLGVATNRNLKVIRAVAEKWCR